MKKSADDIEDTLAEFIELLFDVCRAKQLRRDILGDDDDDDDDQDVNLTCPNDINVRLQ